MLSFALNYLRQKKIKQSKFLKIFPSLTPPHYIVFPMGVSKHFYFVCTPARKKHPPFKVVLPIGGVISLRGGKI